MHSGGALSRFSVRPGSRWSIPAVGVLHLVLAPVAAAQWSTQSPVPTFLDVRGIGAPSAQRVFIATSDDPFDGGGALFESPDGGVSWVQRSVPSSLAEPLNGLFFLDGQNGWAFGNANYRTTDGGATWTELPFLGSTSFMEFYTQNFGLATGNFGAYLSRDGGVSWTPSPDGMSGFAFADGQTGLGISGAGIHRTTDGGATFSPVFAGDARAVVFPSAAVAAGIVDDAFVHSTDGGQTWTAGAPAEGRSRLLAVSPAVLLAWGRTGAFPDYDDRLFRSADGGATWTDLGEVIDGGALAFAVPGGLSVIASDRSGTMYRSADGGLTWAQTFRSPGPAPGFLSSARPVFADAQTGYYGYGAGFLIRTTDGGVTWSQISSGSGQSITGMDRFPNGDLIAVGENGTVLTGNGGVPWILHERFTTSHLRAVQVLGDEDVLVLDEDARVYRSADGGATWTAAPAKPAFLDGRDLHFTTVLDGWVAGSGNSGGALFRTTDGGATWTAVPDFSGAYVAVDIAGSNGWTANVGGRYYRTIDGGATWIQGELPDYPFQIGDMDFFDESIGYAVGMDGYAARSDDGGMSWEMLPVPNLDDDLTDLHLVGANELWVSTNSGVVWYSATGGQNWAVLDAGSPGFGGLATVVATPAGEAWTAGYQGRIEHFTGPPPPPLNRPPDASFDFRTTGLSVSLTDTSTDPDGVVVSWAWEFGDGATSTKRHPTHVFDAADTYIVRLTVTDDDAETGSAVRFIVVQPGPGGTFGDFTEVTPLDPLFVTPQDEDFWVTTTAPADYDNDGDLDVAVFGYYVVYNASVEERLVLFRNDGPAGPDEWEFAYVDVPGGLESGASDLAWGDVDGDGDQDLVVGSNGETVLYRNDGGTLVMTGTVLPGYHEDNDQADFDLRSITWADYDNDGDLDLLIPSVFDWDTYEFRTALMRNDGPDGTGGTVFTEAGTGLAATAHAQSAWADYDGDRDLDLFLVNIAPLTGDGFIRRYRNDGGGAFTGEDLLGTLTIEHGEAQWGDYDGDGDLDIMVAGNIREADGTYDTVLRVYRNDEETWTPIEVIPCPGCEGWYDLTAATWADYDSDGDVDILLAGNYNSGSQIEGRARIYDNLNGVFTDSGNQLPAPRASGSRGGTFSWLDLDGDGDLDYFIAGQYFVPGGNGLVEAQMHVYRNDAPGQNAAPSAPAGLSAIPQAGGSVLLAWTPAGDDMTPAAALTYDLDLFRNGVPVSTARRLPEPGNVSAATHWALAGLPDGSYAWTLRAVDSAYNGGPVAQGAFSVGGTSGADPALPPPRALHFGPPSPNPFSTGTILRFDLPERVRVTLSVHDAAGRLVARLADGVRDPGGHELHWDGSGLAAGTYFLRLSAGDFTKTQRVVLLQ